MFSKVADLKFTPPSSRKSSPPRSPFQISRASTLKNKSGNVGKEEVVCKKMPQKKTSSFKPTSSPQEQRKNSPRKLSDAPSGIRRNAPFVISRASTLKKPSERRGSNRSGSTTAGSGSSTSTSRRGSDQTTQMVMRRASMVQNEASAADITHGNDWSYLLMMIVPLIITAITIIVSVRKAQPVNVWDV